MEFRGLLKHDTNLDEKWCQENALNKTFYNVCPLSERKLNKTFTSKKGSSFIQCLKLKAVILNFLFVTCDQKTLPLYLLRYCLGSMCFTQKENRRAHNLANVMIVHVLLHYRHRFHPPQECQKFLGYQWQKCNFLTIIFKCTIGQFS